VHPSSPADKIRGTENGNFEDLTGRVEPEVGALGKSRAKLGGFAPTRSRAIPRKKKVENLASDCE